MVPETRGQALRQLKILIGQLQALEKQVEEDRYCMDVLDLSLSVQTAFRSLDLLVLGVKTAEVDLAKLIGASRKRPPSSELIEAGHLYDAT